MTKRVAVATAEEVALLLLEKAVLMRGEGVVGVQQWIRFRERLLLLDTSIRQYLGKIEVEPEDDILLVVGIQPSWL